MMQETQKTNKHFFVLELKSRVGWVGEFSVEVRMLLKRDQDQKMQIATSCECAEHSEREHIRWLDKKRWYIEQQQSGRATASSSQLGGGFSQEGGKEKGGGEDCRIRPDTYLQMSPIISI